MVDVENPTPCLKCGSGKAMFTAYFDYPPRLRLKCDRPDCDVRTRDVLLYVPPNCTPDEWVIALEAARPIAVRLWNELGEPTKPGLIS